MQSSKLFTNNVILACAVCVILSFLGQVLQIGMMANIAYAFSLVFVFACYFLSGYSSKLMMFLIFVVAIATTMNGIATVNADYVLHALIMICTFICLEVGIHVSISVKTYKYLSLAFLLMTFIILFLYYFGPLKNTRFKDTGAISLNLSNPNATGLWLVCIFALLFYCGLIYKKSFRFLFMLASIGIIPIVLATDSRNSFLACIFLVVGVVVTKIFKINKVPNWVLAVLACLPLIVFAFYMFVIVENMEFWESLLSLDGFDKGIDSRHGIWRGVLNNFWDCFLIGDYPKYFNSQQHNSLLTIYCRFGVFATIASCVLIYRALKLLQKRTSFYATLSLSAILFTGCFEASVFTGVAGLYLMLLLVPSCASVEQI